MGNYFEFIVMDGDHDIDIPEGVFFKLLHSVRNKSNACFQKHYKEYVYRNMFYENDEKNQVKIYKKSLSSAHKTLDGMKLLVFNKEKLPYHAFPCTKALHSVSYVSKVIGNIEVVGIVN